MLMALYCWDKPGPRVPSRALSARSRDAPRIGCDELLQRFQAFPRPIPAAGEAGRAHCQAQHEHGNLAAAAGPPEPLMHSIDRFLPAFLKPGWTVRLLACPLRKPLTDTFPVCGGPLTQLAEDISAQQLPAALLALAMAVKCLQQAAAALDAGCTGKGVAVSILFVALCWEGGGLMLHTISPLREGCCASCNKLPHACCPFDLVGMADWPPAKVQS